MPRGNRKSTLLLLAGLAVMAGLGLATQYEHPNQMCLIRADAYSEQRKNAMAAEFRAFLGSENEADWAAFSSAIEVYLSAAFYVCVDQDSVIKDCVQTKIGQIEAILVNEEHLTPKERWRVLLLMPAPRSCKPEGEEISARSEQEQAAWRAAGQKNHRLMMKFLKDAPLSSRIAHNQIILSLMRRDAPESAALLRSGLSQGGEDARLSYANGLAELQSGSPESALKHFLAASNETNASAFDSMALKLELGLASGYRLSGQLDEADELMGKLIEKAQAALGADHEILAHLYYERAWIRADRRRYGAAQKYLRNATKIWTRVHGASHPKLLDVKIAMALAQIEGDVAYDAGDTLKDALQLHEAIGGEAFKKIEIKFLQALTHSESDSYLDRAMTLASEALFSLRQLDEKHPKLEAGIQRWLESL